MVAEITAGASASSCRRHATMQGVASRLTLCSNPNVKPSRPVLAWPVPGIVQHNHRLRRGYAWHIRPELI